MNYIFFCCEKSITLHKCILSTKKIQTGQTSTNLICLLIFQKISGMTGAKKEKKDL